MLELDEPTTGTYPSGRSKKVMDQLLPSLELPSRRGASAGRGLGAVAMNDPMQDETTLVSGHAPILQLDEPAGGGTQVASVPSGGTHVGPAPLPIPTMAPIPVSIIPGGRGAPRSPLPFMVVGVAAAMTWGAAVAAGVMHEPHELPDLAGAELSSFTTPTAPSASTSTSASTTASASAAAADEDSEPSSDPAPDGDRGVEAARSKPAPTPPAAASWTATADATPRALRLSGSTAIGSFEASVVGFANGGSAWTFESKHENAFVLSDGSVAVVLGDAIAFLAPEDGSERARSEVPALGDKVPVIVSADADAEHILVALADARFVLFTPSACAAEEAERDAECVRVIGRLTGEYLEPEAKVALGEDGTRYLAEEDALRAFDLDLRPVFEASTPADIRSLVRVPGGRMALQFGQEVALLDRERCRGRSEVRIRTTDSQAPSGCVLWRFGRAIDPVPPAAVDTSSLALNERGKLQVVTEGDDIWKIQLGAFGPVAQGGDASFTLATEGDAVVVAEVDSSNGAVRARHPLPITPAAEDHAYAQLVWNAGILAASVGPHIGVITLAP